MKLGSRGSPLAMTQSRLVAGLLARATGEAETAFPIQSFVTSGDRIADRRLQDAGGKGLFTKELDEALLDRRIDVAIHSLKDLPTRMPDGIVLAAIPAREDPRDAFISHKAHDLKSLLAGAIVGTASLRRQAQALHLRPDLKIVTLRGSVETRLKRLADGTMDATFLALAGLTRLGLTQHATSLIDSEIMPPAPGQGAVRHHLSRRRCRHPRDPGKTLHPAIRDRGGGRTRLSGSAGRLLPHTHWRPDADREWHPVVPWRSAGAGRQQALAAPRVRSCRNRHRTNCRRSGPQDRVAIRAEAGETFIQSLEKRGW